MAKLAAADIHMSTPLFSFVRVRFCEVTISACLYRQFQHLPEDHPVCPITCWTNDFYALITV
ncbi:hypothetical protein [Pseudobacillus badius]|uniref:hypothetical protein n=1 Tax=Bacillus badius TaxID=1455 RepID=UPI000A813300|nr:hypothetical protein [Bacillus badius]